ncbi:hypothetical protein F5Y13DRAFT_191679 [Hypoxylon sp. FL1857]|nr:hypothetical protein F5Y13DRAFT_191679 [Hypoxylon sp. FL1857]
MAEPSAYRDRGFGEGEARHSRHKRTRGGDGGPKDDVKRVGRRFDDCDYGAGYERTRSMSPRDRARRESLRESRYDETTRSGPRDYVPRSNSPSRREAREAHYAERPKRRDSRSDYRVIDRSPSTSSTRHHDRHSSHHRHHHHHHHRHHRSSTRSTRTLDELPFGARPLVRSDLETFKPLFAQYLDVQKRKDIATMDEREIRGRWKSFVGKWNHGDLAEGWYRPETLEEARKSGAGVGVGVKADTRDKETVSPLRRSEQSQDLPAQADGDKDGDSALSEAKGDDDNDDDDEYGPTLPPGTADPARSTAKHGPGIPSLQDLDLRREAAEEERLQRIDALRLARRADRAEQKARLEDLVPRAEPGTRERRLEKKREVNEKMRAFRERSPGGGGGATEVGEAELMGGGDGVAEYKRMKAAAERRRTEREVRREEEGRAREREREERVREYRRREEGTMEVLKRIARERFG